ncbi:MAG: hypothetical protein IT355_06665 [Gemmatimonadaceae bacterium]|nr:hypothetical protein [Gemmatimonadaceae bacterium]
MPTPLVTPRRLRRICLWLGALVAASGFADAQAIRVTATTPLDFGTLSPLVTKTVTPASASAGVFTVQGPASSTVYVLVVTPNQLSGTSQWVQPTSWVATVTTQFGTSPSAIPLVAGAEQTVTLGTDGLATVRIGATLTPPMTVGSGTFTGGMTVVARSDVASGFYSLTAQSTVTAIVRQPLVLTAVPMAFGSVFVSTPKTLAPTDVSAFRMLVDGATGATIEVTLESVPASLDRSGGGGTLAIGSWLSRSGGASCTGSAVTPTVGVAQSLDLTSPAGSSGRTSYCLGATVTPSALQAAGNYTGTVVLSVRYTGA